MNMHSSEKRYCGLTLVGWLFVFCIFNLLVTMAFFCAAVRRMPMHYSYKLHQMNNPADMRKQ